MRETNSCHMLDFTSVSVWVHNVTQPVLDKLGLGTTDLIQSSPLC